MKNNIFGFQQQSDEEEEEKQVFNPKNQKSYMNSRLSKMNEDSKKKVAEEMSKYIFEDPTIYTYDDHYDQIQNQRKSYEEKVLKVNRPNQPKHLEAIREATERRQREVSIVLERMNEKKLKQEGENFKDKEMFVTSSYVEMLEKNKKYEEQQKKNEEYDQMHTVEGGVISYYKFINYQKKMDDFWRNMYEEQRPDLSKEINSEKQNPIKPKTQLISVQIQKIPEESPKKIIQNQIQEPKIEKIDKKSSQKQKLSKSRSRENSKEKIQEKQQLTEKNSAEQEQEIVEPIKQLTKEEKLEQARKRFLERKQSKQ